MLLSPGCPWEQAVPLTFFGRMRRAFRRCFGLSPPSERQIPPRVLPPVPRARDWETEAAERNDAPPIRDEFDASQVLLDETKARCGEEQRRRTAHWVSELFREGLARKKALKAQRLAASQQLQASSCVMPPAAPSTWPRKRAKFYAVRKGRQREIVNTWEECERHTKGVSSEFKSFGSYEEASAYLLARRLNFMTFHRSVKPPSSFVGGKALRAQVDVWQD